MSLDLQNSGDEIMEDAVPQVLDEMNQQSEHSKQVPLAALESERSKRQQLEDENRMMRDHFAMLQARQQPQQQSRQDETDGMDESDVMTIGEFKKLSGKIKNEFQLTLDELKMSQKYPDYQTVISKYLPEVIKSNPNIKGSLEKTQDYELAYYLSKNSDAYKSDNKKSVRHADAERILKNTQTSGTLSSVGQSTPMSQVKKYKDMSDSDFKNLMNRNLGY
ncbi:MAG TPA: hypothetical protein VMX17_10445 [Candidatus Glassbacteria bacterium]|nr:hypothetical protein [Candidatus Glassbacteria bacterium]